MLVVGVDVEVPLGDNVHQILERVLVYADWLRVEALSPEDVTARVLDLDDEDSMLIGVNASVRGPKRHEFLQERRLPRRSFVFILKQILHALEMVLIVNCRGFGPCTRTPRRLRLKRGLSCLIGRQRGRSWRRLQRSSCNGNP